MATAAAASTADPATVRRTIDALSKIIKKPPLKEKLVGRPPFRFVHDIIIEVSKASGFYSGLYSGAELDSKSFADKESKMAFLQKAIDVLAFVRGDFVKVRASKIVAGQEVEQTNEFLQLIAIAVLKKLDSAEAVRKVLKGERPVNKKRGGKKEVGRGKEEGEERGKERPTDAKGRVRGGEKVKDSREKEGRGEKDRVREKKNEGTHQKVAGSEEEKREVEKTEVGEEEVIQGESSDQRLDERPSTVRGGRRRMETGERESGGKEREKPLQPPSPPEPTDDATTQPPPPPSGLITRRPSSARPAPPRVVQHHHPSSSDDINNINATEGDTSVAPPTVIMDTPDHNDDADKEEKGVAEDDKEYIVGADSTPLAPPTIEKSDPLQSVDTTNEKPEGVLTKTIVATKERLEGVGSQSGGEAVLEETITPTQRRREMEAVRKEMEKLREDIQLLCRYTNPMGRVMDYLQEDTDTMVQELERWREENNNHRESLRREESVTENELAPLKSQLEEVELHILEQREKIGSLKATIIRQDNHIKKMMNSIIPTHT